MNKRLIVNADDFGLSEAVNYGIVKAYKEGIVTSTSIMANMPGFDHAVALSKQYPDLAIGVHLTLTTYKPVLTTHQHIVREDGYFRSQKEINEVDPEEAYKELKAQIEKVIQSGIKIDHFDSHHHIHTKPALKNVVEQLYKEYNLPFRGGFTYDTMIDHKTRSDIRFYDEGVTIKNLKDILRTMDDQEVYELMCHPAYIDSFLFHSTSYAMKRMEEVDILCSTEVKQFIKEENITLMNYTQL